MSDVIPPPPPGVPYSQPPFAAQPPNNNLVFAILTTILCCLPFGIVAIIKAAEVNTKWAQGDYAGAQASAEAAKKWSLVSAGAALIVVLLYVGFIALAAVNA